MLPPVVPVLAVVMLRCPVFGQCDHHCRQGGVTENVLVNVHTSCPGPGSAFPHGPALLLGSPGLEAPPPAVLLLVGSCIRKHGPELGIWVVLDEPLFLGHFSEQSEFCFEQFMSQC